MTRRLALMLALLAPATAVAKPQRMSKAAFKPATRPPSYVQLRKLAKLVEPDINQ